MNKLTHDSCDGCNKYLPIQQLEQYDNDLQLCPACSYEYDACQDHKTYKAVKNMESCNE